jgi:ribosomal protein L32
MRRESCPNMNHRRTDAPVRWCPNCGEVVNANIIVKQCSVEEHAERRMNGNQYCVHCGLQLIK